MVTLSTELQRFNAAEEKGWSIRDGTGQAPVCIEEYHAVLKRLKKAILIQSIEHNQVSWKRNTINESQAENVRAMETR